LLQTQTAGIHCPYCGESIEVIIDCSIMQQTYTEDCSVCCKPMTLEINIDNGEMTVYPRHEND